MAQSTTIKDARPTAETSDVARVAGRGTVYITAAKLWFIASGWALHVILSRLMTADEYGLYQVVISDVSIINAVIITGTYQTVSKYISQEEEKADAVKSKALKLQAIVGGAITLAFFLLAPVIADYLNDSRLTRYFRLASLITLSYSFYSVFTGYFNGQKKFLAQAGLDITYSTLKLALIVLFVWLGYGVAGGVGGFVMAAASVLLISALAASGGNRQGDIRISDLFKFQAYLLLFTLVLNLLQKVDLNLVKALSATDAEVASMNAAYYGAAINVANITYQVIISVTFVIFPLVSQATWASDRARAQMYISNTLRYTLMIMALTATLFSANAREVLQVIFPTHPFDYRAGSGALAALAFGMLFFGLLYVITTIITASGRPKVSLAVGAVTLASSATLNALLIPRHGLVGAGVGTTVAMAAGAFIGGGYLMAKFGPLVSALSVARITACAGVVYAASLVISLESKLMIVAQLALLSLIYFALLVVTKEIGRTDLEAVKKIIKR
jgi:stage V sporulation protein B